MSGTGDLLWRARSSRQCLAAAACLVWALPAPRLGSAQTPSLFLCDARSADGGGVAEPGKYDFEEKLKGGDDSDVWRVSWNVTGTTLASAGKEDNIVRLWLGR